jgi:hypothetical protein
LDWRECKSALRVCSDCGRITKLGVLNSLVLAAVYCLMVGHPGLVFNQEHKDRTPGHDRQELHEYPS